MAGPVVCGWLIPTSYRQSDGVAPFSKGGAATAAGNWGQQPRVQKFCLIKFWSFCCRAATAKAAEPADKPGSVMDSHSSRRIVTDTLKQPTRTRRGPRHEVPIWSCSRWGLPCRSVAGLAVRSYRTISPLPRIPKDRSAVSFCCTFRRLAPPRGYLAPCPVEPGLSSASASTEMDMDDATAWPTPPRALSHQSATTSPRRCPGSALCAPMAACRRVELARLLLPR